MTKSCWMRLLRAAIAHVKNKFERKTKTGRRFHGRGIFFRQSRRRGKFLGPRIALQNPINSCQSGADKQFVQVTTARGYDDCIVASWSKNAPPTCVDRERLCKNACREYLRLPAKVDCLRSR